MPSIAVDVMSGDSGAPECVPGALRALEADGELELILVGNPEVIEPALAGADGAVRARASVHPAASVVGMSEHPREAIRRRKDSSMRLAIDLVKEGRAQAMVSAGNTGALTAMSHFVLKTVGPVERAPIMSVVPARNGAHTHMLDLGANSKATAQQLAQFATMGSIVARDVYGIANPRVGLLNIGEEDEKGNAVAKEAHTLLRNVPSINYIGNVEGRDIPAASFKGKRLDVVVCDGFVGNVVLKFYESAGRLFLSMIKQDAPEVLQRPDMAGVLKKFDYTTYGGAPLLGVQGVAIICHGSSPARATR